MKKKIVKHETNQSPAGETNDSMGRDFKENEECMPAMEAELNAISLTYAEKLFKDGWDSDDREENDYRNNFQKDIEKMEEESGTFQFLQDEPDIYTEADIKRK